MSLAIFWLLENGILTPDVSSSIMASVALTARLHIAWQHKSVLPQGVGPKTFQAVLVGSLGKQLFVVS